MENTMSGTRETVGGQIVGCAQILFIYRGMPNLVACPIMERIFHKMQQDRKNLRDNVQNKYQTKQCVVNLAVVYQLCLSNCKHMGQKNQDILYRMKKSTYCEQVGKRLDSFSKAIKHIARVVRSNEWLLKEVSKTSTASDSVTCSKELYQRTQKQTVPIQK